MKYPVVTSLDRYTEELVWAWFVVGVLVTILGFWQLLYPWTALLLLWPGYWLLRAVYEILAAITQYSKMSVLLLGVTLATWLSHLIQVFVPETGFDAVWYHLPIIKNNLLNHGIVYQPDRYQSVNPWFSDGILALGYMVQSDVGVKIVSYALGFTLVLTTYRLARLWLTREWALLFIVWISSLQVLSWQVASAYVDVSKAVWEVAALYLILRPQTGLSMLQAGWVFSASLATKVFSVLLWPVFVLLVLLRESNQRIRSVVLFLLGSIFVSLPYYLFAFRTTGHPFYSVVAHLDKLAEIGGQASPVKYVLERLSSAWLLPWRLLTVPDYIGVGALVLIPILIWYAAAWWRDQKLRLLLLFSLVQIAIWWLVPPLSTRYALSGFITLILLELIVTERVSKNKPQLRMALVATIIITVVWNLVPRLAVNYRSSKYIFGTQTRQQYLQQFLDGHVDQHLQAWHGIKK